MKPEQIFEALSFVDEELLQQSENETDASDRSEETNASNRSEETGKKSGHKILMWRSLGTLAACACLALVLFTVSPLRIFFMRAGSSSSSAEDYEMAADGESNSDSALGTSPDSDEAAGGEAATTDVWVTSAGYDYLELTVDDIAEYELTEEELYNIPESDVGEQIGTVEDASDENLMGNAIYTSVNHENLYIVDTESGYLYFYK